MALDIKIAILRHPQLSELTTKVRLLNSQRIIGSTKYIFLHHACGTNGFFPLLFVPANLYKVEQRLLPKMISCDSYQIKK
ncbi:MAG: hypothetical protein ACI89Z_001252 [Porticoccus sp.]|jgi:hypothetical protein